MPDERTSLFRRLARRLSGTGAATPEIRELQRVVRSIAEGQRDQATAVDARLEALRELVSQQSTRKDATEILQAVRALVRSSDRALANSSPGGTDDSDRADARLYRALDSLAKSKAPIIVGPWTGEVGFELLYWVPFVQWFCERWRIEPGRLIVVSRGGVGSWYGLRDARYADIFSFVSPGEFRAGTDVDAHKQRELTAFEKTIVDAVTRRLQLQGPLLLHPQLMYRAFSPFWRDEVGFGAVARFASHRRLAPADHPMRRDLPREYVAARFYFSDCFPDTPANRLAAKQAVESVAQRLPVVLLNPGVHVDDHADYSPDASTRIVPMPAMPLPEENLAVQSAIIGHARGFIGTYGGFSYLAPFYGVPALAFYSDRAFKLHHLHVAERVFEQLRTASVVPVCTEDTWLMRAATASVTG